MSLGDIGTFIRRVVVLVATSSTHSEMRAIYSLAVDIDSVVNLCKELGGPITLPCVVLEDNEYVIENTSEISGRAKRCKHFLIKELVSCGLLVIQKVDTKLNDADILTKVLTGNELLCVSSYR
jgi:hypothetical protein